MRDQTFIASCLAAFVSLAVGYFSYRNSRVANSLKQGDLQQQFTQQVMADVATAKKDAADARTDAATARRDSEDTERRHRGLQREMDAMQDWVDRVVRARDSYMADHSDEAITDTGVLRIMRAINGGPHLAEH